jgi:hypothetical protein
MPLRDLVFASLFVLSLAACTTRTTPAQAPPASGPGASQPVVPLPGAADAGGPIDHLAGPDAARPSRYCETDSDCAVKDVGNCCGYFPMCVNKDARTDPAAVLAQCRKDDMASICGFREISACQCVDNQCEALEGGAVAR